MSYEPRQDVFTESIYSLLVYLSCCSTVSTDIYIILLVKLYIKDASYSRATNALSKTIKREKIYFLN